MITSFQIEDTYDTFKLVLINTLWISTNSNLQVDFVDNKLNAISHSWNIFAKVKKPFGEIETHIGRNKLI